MFQIFHDQIGHPFKTTICHQLLLSPFYKTYLGVLLENVCLGFHISAVTDIQPFPCLIRNINILSSNVAHSSERKVATGFPNSCYIIN